MNPLHNDLWDRIAAFQLDEPGAPNPFLQRLAEENRWSREEARLAIEEYKRFVFLGLVAGHGVAPSDEVDQVWHLHLTYTKSYWETWCGATLGRSFHHHPSRGDQEDADKYRKWYRKTLESYRIWFEQEPPKRFWPPVQERFSSDRRFARIDVNRNWVLRKPRLSWLEPLRDFQSAWWYTIRAQELNVRSLPPLPACAALLLIPVLLVGCDVVLQSSSPLNYKGPEFLDFFWKIWFVSLGLAIALRWLLRWPGEQDMRTSDLRPDPYLVATVRGRGVLAGTAAMASLVHSNFLEADKNGSLKKTSKTAPSDLHPLQKAVLREVRASSSTRVADVRLGIAQELRELEMQAERQGFFTPPGFRKLARRLPFVLAFAVPVFGTAKIIVGVYRDKPVAFLVILTIVAALVALCGFLRDPYRSRRGGAWLRRLARRYRGLKSGLKGSAQSDQLALAVGLFGTSVLATLGDEVLKQAFTPRGSSSSSSCGGGCGGDGGSGCGGGGCGGCGGD